MAMDSQCWRPVGRDFGRRAVDTYGTCEEPGGCQHVAFLGNEHVDDLAVLVNGPIDVPPGPRHLDVRLVDEPTTTRTVAARLGRLHQDRRESLDPTEQRHVIDLDASFSEKLFQVPVGESVAQIPPDGEQDHPQ